jgi:hypothetical protein
MSEINKQANNYFASFTPAGEEPLSAHLNEEDLALSNCLLANDSLFLLAPIFPGGGCHAHYQVYKIPIKKIGK